MNILNKIKLTSQSALALFGVVVLGVSAAIYAVTDAGEDITNLASVSYFDENGNDYTATSNPAVVTVGSVYSAEIQADQLGVLAAPGQTVYIPYTITNTGNDTDTYTLAVANESGGNGAEGASTNGAGGSDIDGANLEVYEEITVNGQPDAGESVVTSVSVDAGETVNLVVAVTIPSGSAANDEVGLVLTATSVNTVVDDVTPDAGGFGTGVNQTDDTAAGGTLNVDDAGMGQDDLDNTVQGLITVTTGPVLVATKSSNLDIGAGANGQITYTLQVKNNGGDATNVDIFDAIPTNTTYTASSITVSGLIDRVGTTDDDLMLDFTAADFELVDAPSFVLADNIGAINEPTGVDLDGDGTPSETGIDGFIFRDVSLENGVTVSITYTVDLAAGLAAGTDIINTFCAKSGAVTGVTPIVLDADSSTCSNQTTDTVPQVYAVDADDTDGNGDLTPGDGTDDPGDTATVGDDEDGFDDDNQYENSASVGESVDFRNVITNNGNGPDNFDLVVDMGVSNTFPAGTNFTFWDETGAVPLTDDSGNGIPDTGNIAAGGFLTVTVRAQLPASIGTATVGGAATINFQNNQYFIDVASGGNTINVHDGGNGSDNDFGTAPDNERFAAIMTATSVGSVNDANAATASDTKLESLGVINAGGVDIANATFGGNTDGGPTDIVSSAADVNLVTDVVGVITVDTSENAGDDVAGNLFDGTANVHGDDDTTGIAQALDASDFTLTRIADVGETFTLDLVVANEAGSSDAYLLSVVSLADTAGSTAAVSTFTAGAPLGWTVIFKDEDGSTITSTPSIPGGSAYHFTAEVTVSTDASQALETTLYYLGFAANSAANPSSAATLYTATPNGVSDVKVDRVMINAFCSISVIPNGNEQVQPGGTEDFEHTLSNAGNSEKVYDLRSYVQADDQGADDASWTSTIFVDTVNDTIDAPTLSLAQALATNTPIVYFDNANARQTRLAAVIVEEAAKCFELDGTTAANDPADCDGATPGEGVASFSLDPGESLQLWNRVFAPSTAADGQTFTSTLEADVETATATGCTAGGLIIATDTAEVIESQVRLEKTVAVDMDCDCQSNGLTFAEISGVTVNPGQCVIWRLLAENEGATNATTVVINDAVTQFTVLASETGETPPAIYGVDNRSGNTTAPVDGTNFVASACLSEDAGGETVGAVDCTDTANHTSFDVTSGTDQLDYNAATGALIYRVGDGATAAAGGTLEPGDRAVAQFCAQVL